MEWHSTEDGKYRIESLSTTTLPGALKVIKENFYVDEPVSIGAEVYKSIKAQDELLELCADAALDGVSIVAVYVATGVVASVAFNKLQVNSSDSSEKSFFEVFTQERCTDPSAKSLMNFMINVDSRFNLFDFYKTDCTFEIMFLATDKEHRKNNLATLVCKYSCELGNRLKNGPIPSTTITVQDLGPKYAHMKTGKPVTKIPKAIHAIFTAPGSRKVGYRLNFTVHLSVSYDEFIFNGKTYLERLGDYSTHCELVAKSLV